MKILIIDGHSYHKGLASRLATAYAEGARNAGHEVRLVKIRDLKFDPILRYGYRKIMELEPDLLVQQENIKWCEHLVMTTPIWWMGLPALLKGFIDRTIVPGFAYSYGKRKLIPKGLLKGRSARVIYTQGAPRWATVLAFFDAHWFILKFGVLKFIGLSPVKRFAVGNAEKLGESGEDDLLKKINKLGRDAQ